MKIPTTMKVEYNRAKNYEIDQVPGAVWSYYIRESDENVYGFAGGLLTRDALGGWIAHYWNEAQGVPAQTREQAILNVLPLAAEIVQRWREQKEKNETVFESRMNTAHDLQKLFPAGCGLVTVRDTTATHEAVSPEARFKVTFTFDNLTEEQVILLAAQQPERK